MPVNKQTELAKTLFWKSSILLVLVEMFHNSISILLMFSDRKKVGMYYLGSTEICNLGQYVHIMF